MVFPEPLPETIFRGPKCRFSLKSPVLERFRIFRGSQNLPKSGKKQKKTIQKEGAKKERKKAPIPFEGTCPEGLVLLPTTYNSCRFTNLIPHKNNKEGQREEGTERECRKGARAESNCSTHFDTPGAP